MSPKEHSTPSDKVPALTTPKKRLSQSDVPSHTLAEALRVPEALRDEYANQPASPVDVGAALGMQPTTGGFRSLAGAALAYGLTDGGPRVPAIGLTDLGKRAVAPTEEGDDLVAKREAFTTPRVIKEFLTKYDGNKLPSEQIAENVLAQLGVPREVTGKTLDLIINGADGLGLIRDIGTGRFVQLAGSRRPTDPEPELHEANDVDEDGDGLALPTRSPVVSGHTDHPEEQTPRSRPNAIFLGHGKNRKPLEQLIRTLDQYGIPHKEAIEEANRGRPISAKVADTMRDCGAAILIFSADEQFLDRDGNETWRPSENVVHELGAASVLYENRIIVFKEEAVNLATNYSDIGYIRFEKDHLDAKVNELFKELIAFGLIKVSVGD